mgnify:CR=1 FL=1
MENYNLLYLKNLQQTKPLAGEEVDSLYEEITEDLSYLESDCDSDSATLNGKEVDALGVLSDEAVNSMIKSQSSGKQTNVVKSYVTTLLNSSYKVVRSVKQAIADFFNDKKSASVKPNPNPTPNPIPIDDDDDFIIDDDDYDDHIIDDDSDDDDDIPTDDNDVLEMPSTEIELGRKNINGSNSRTVTISSQGVTLTLRNTLFDSDYKYVIKSTGSNETVKFDYLDNGRLVITGNNLQIDALSGQKDDIIINGHNNKINTRDEGDLIRLGMTVDMSGIREDINGSGTDGQEFLNDLYNSCNKNTYGNEINAGSGSDYIYDYTNGWNGSTFIANTLKGDGNNDAYRNDNIYVEIESAELSYMQTRYGLNNEETNIFQGNVASMGQNGNASNSSDIEDIYSLTSKQRYDNQLYTLESFGQGGLGDCRFVALMASLKDMQGGLSSLGISITGKDNGIYTVKFNNCPYTYKGVNININDLYKELKYSDTGTVWGKTNIYASGDLTMRLIEYALNKLIGKNFKGKVNGKSFTWDLETASWNDYSRYLFGNDKVSMFYNNSMKFSDYFGSNKLEDVFSEDNVNLIKNYGYNTVDEYFEGVYGTLTEYFDYWNRHDDNHNEIHASGSQYDMSMGMNEDTLQSLWAKYKNGTISNIVAFAAISSEKLQICDGHEYAISDVTENYVELINPWDSQDRLRLDKDDFFKYFSNLTVFGSDSVGNISSKEIYNGYTPDADSANSNYGLGDFDNDPDDNPDDNDTPLLLKIEPKPVYGYKTSVNEFSLNFEDEENIFVKKIEV